MTGRLDACRARCEAAPLALRRGIGFVLVGGASTAIYAGVTWAAVRLHLLPTPLASALAYGIGSIWSYLGHRAVTFRGVRPRRRAGLRFLALALAGYGLAIGVPAIVERWLGGALELAILATCLVIPLANYLVLSRLVFAGPPAAAQSAPA